MNSVSSTPYTFDTLVTGMVITKLTSSYDQIQSAKLRKYCCQSVTALSAVWHCMAQKLLKCPPPLSNRHFVALICQVRRFLQRCPKPSRQALPSTHHPPLGIALPKGQCPNRRSGFWKGASPTPIKSQVGESVQWMTTGVKTHIQ